MESNVEAESNQGKVAASAAPVKKDLTCKYCNKKFSNYQALGGHQNAHKDERAAAQKEKILSMASAYDHKNSYAGGFVNSNQSYYGLGVSPLSMPRFKSRSWPHLGLLKQHHHVPWPRHHQILNSVQPTIHQLQTLMAEGSGFLQQQQEQHHKTLAFPILREGALNPSGSQLLNPSLCDKGNDFGQASNSSIIEAKGSDHENSGEANNFSSMPANEDVKEIDLTLKI